MKHFIFFSTLINIILLFSCSPAQEKGEESILVKNDNIKASFAQNFSVIKQGNLTILSIGEAWRGAGEEFRYVLYPKETKKPEGFKNAVKIAVPVDKVICTGTSQVAMLDFLGVTDKIAGIADGKYIYNSNIRKRLISGDLSELGNDQGLNYEKALSVNPDLVFAFSFGRTQSYKKFEELGIPVVMISEFMEDTPLGRAEWAVFMSYFFGNEALAQKEFDKISKKYSELQKLFSGIPTEKKPKVLVGVAQEGSWYIPGGKSFIARFIEDAGAYYLWADNEERGGVPLDFESVLFKGQNADFWLNVVLADNKKQLLAADSRYSSFKAFKNDKIYSYTARISENGGYDFYESAIVRPDLVLADLIKIFHSDLLSNHQLYYYKKITD